MCSSSFSIGLLRSVAAVIISHRPFRALFPERRSAYHAPRPGGDAAAVASRLPRVGAAGLQQKLGTAELEWRGRLDPAGADPPCGMDLVPAMLRVCDPWADDLDPRALGGNGYARTVVRDHLDDQVAADPLVAAVQELLVARVEPKIDVQIAVVGLELNLADRADGDRTAALHVQALRVVDAGQRVAPAAVRRGRRDVPLQAARGGTRGEEE